MVCLGRPYCLPQILIGPFLNTLTQIKKNKNPAKNAERLTLVKEKVMPEPIKYVVIQRSMSHTSDALILRDFICHNR